MEDVNKKPVLVGNSKKENRRRNGEKPVVEPKRWKPQFCNEILFSKAIMRILGILGRRANSKVQNVKNGTKGKLLLLKASKTK